MSQLKPKPAPKAVTPIQRAHLQRELTQTQTELSELAADMIGRGGDSRDVQNLICALLSHKWRGMIRVSDSNSQEQQDRQAASYAEQYRWETYLEIVRAWPKTRSMPDGSVSETVRDMVRSNVRHRLTEAFQDFVGGSNSETLVEAFYLMADVLESCNQGDPLPEAFIGQIDSSDVYVRVDYRHQERVEEFAKLLSNGCGKKSAAATGGK